jgi:hypothetical protein
MKTLHIAKAPTQAEMLSLSHDEKLKRVSFFVEANSYEQLSLWREFYKNVKPEERLEWIQDSLGFMRQVGELKNKPVMVSFSFYVIGNTYICFYYACSNFVDYKMVEDYIKTNFPVMYDNDTRAAMTDASNFMHCLSFCEGKFKEQKDNGNTGKK